MARRKKPSKCETCGAVFHPVYQSSGKYCSMKCSVRSGRKHHAWKGDNAGYAAVHSWLREHHEHEKKSCDFCGSTKRLEWAKKKGKPYTRARKNYHILCAKCHKKYDAHEPWNKGIRPHPKNCEHCGVEFVPAKKSRRFCSNACAQRWLALNTK